MNVARSVVTMLGVLSILSMTACNSPIQGSETRYPRSDLDKSRVRLTGLRSNPSAKSVERRTAAVSVTSESVSSIDFPPAYTLKETSLKEMSLPNHVVTEEDISQETSPPHPQEMEETDVLAADEEDFGDRILQNVPEQQQQIWYYCAPTTVSMILASQGVEMDQFQLAEEMGTYEPYGTHNRDAIRVLNRHLFG